MPSHPGCSSTRAAQHHAQARSQAAATAAQTMRQPYRALSSSSFFSAVGARRQGNRTSPGAGDRRGRTAGRRAAACRSTRRRGSRRTRTAGRRRPSRLRALRRGSARSAVRACRDRARRSPDVPIDRRSPPLPFTASTRTGWPVSGSGSVNFELVLPPPKFVMRRSAPEQVRTVAEQLERDSPTAWRRRPRPRDSAGSWSRSTPCQAQVNSTHVLKAAVFGVPPIGVERLEPFDRERSIDDRARFRRASQPRRSPSSATPMLPSAVASAGPAVTVRPVASAVHCFSRSVARAAADDANLVEAAAGQLLERFEDGPVAERQALENRARERRSAQSGSGWPVMPAVLARWSPACPSGSGTADSPDR